MSETDPEDKAVKSTVVKTPDDQLRLTDDDQLRLTDDGIELPEFLKGFVGEFTIRTPSITGDLETSDEGMPTTEYYDGVLACMPTPGDYNEDLAGNVLAISTPDHAEIVYEIVDERSPENK